MLRGRMKMLSGFILEIYTSDYVKIIEWLVILSGDDVKVLSRNNNNKVRQERKPTESPNC